MKTKPFPTLDSIDVTGKRVVVRMDLNVPMVGGRVTDTSRVVRLLPTLKELIKKKAKIIILSHLGRPEGKYVPSLSLAPVVDALSQALGGVPVGFGVDCIGAEANKAVASLKKGEVVLLENLRFHEGEEKNSPAFAKALAAHGDVYVNDAFSCSHRAHASVVGITKYLPFAAGRLMEEELSNLETYLSHPARPLTAIVGGAKVSTKIALLKNLVAKVDTLVIGGAMANTFLLAKGHQVGKSLVEPDLVKMAKIILDAAAKPNAERKACTILLPVDAVKKSSAVSGTTTTPIHKIDLSESILDVGNHTLRRIADCLAASKTVIWNGPLGKFETRPYDVSTLMIAREIAGLTAEKKLTSIAGGGDTIAALALADMGESFTYISTAGGAFLEWMEGKTLPGVDVLLQKHPQQAKPPKRAKSLKQVGRK
jgi:phosphoglycerate kinase